MKACLVNQGFRVCEPMASIFRKANQGKKEKYIFASKIFYTILRTNEQHYLPNFIRGSRRLSSVISIPHLVVAYIDKT